MGRRLVRVQVNRPDLRWPFPPRMAERLTGARVDALGRRSKYLLADLDTGETLIVHLGMSGRMLVSGVANGGVRCQNAAPQKHDHVVVDIEGGARLTFNDARRFGAMVLIATKAVSQHRLLAGLGPEPLGNAFDEPYLVAALKARSLPVKSALLDQRIVAGPGQHLRLRGAPPRQDLASAQVQTHLASAGRGACPRHPTGVDRGHRRRRFVAARFSPGGRRTWLFSTCFPGLWPRSRAVSDPRMRWHDPPGGAIGAIQLLLPGLSKMT